MKTVFGLFLSASLLLATPGANAFWATDMALEGLSKGLDATSFSLTYPPSKWKVILAAKEDAATFIASEGDIKGLQLASALEIIRAANPNETASDVQISQWILAQ